MEPSDQIFDDTHVLYDNEGNVIQSRKSASSPTSAVVADTDEQERLPALLEAHKGVVHSVFLAEGLHLSIDPDEVDELPRRFEAGSSKARLTWFGVLCLAGIGMFVEAYVIITTGQIKTM